MPRVLIMIWIVLALGLVAACAKQENPSDVVSQYFQAAVAADADKMRSLSCAEWESSAARQAQSFRTVKSTLENVSCTQGGADGQYTLVTCQGAIVMDYNGEKREFPLATYRVIQEGGSWRYCGEGGE